MQLPAWQGFGGRLAATGGLAAFGAGGRRVVAGSGVGVAAYVAFEEPSGKFVAEQTRACFALQEGDELVLFGMGEHAFKDVVGGSEPLLSQLFSVGVGGRVGGSHEWFTPEVERVQGDL